MGPQAAGAEIIPDAEAGEGLEPGERNENGFTEQEQSDWDAMRSAETPADDAPAAGSEAAADGVAEGGEEEAGDADGDAEGTEPAPAVAEAGKAPADPAAAAVSKTPKTVNRAKYDRDLARANQRAEEQTARANKEHEDRIKLNARVELINEALRQQPPAATPPPDPNAPPTNPFEEEDIDPNVDYAAAVSQLNRRTRFQYDSQQTLAQDFTQSNEDRAIKETFNRDASAYAASADGQSFPQAYQFLKDSRLTEICITKFDKDPNDKNEVFTPQEVQAMVNIFNQEEKWVVSEAIKAKKSPALAIMKLAKARGFKPQIPQNPTAGQQAVPIAPKAPPAGQAPAVRPAAPAAPAAAAAPVADVSAQLAELRQNQADGRSLSDGGGVPAGGLSMEMILRLGDEEFAELVESLPKHQLDSLMGRVPT